MPGDLAEILVTLHRRERRLRRCDMAVFWAAITILLSVSLLLGAAFVSVSVDPRPRCVEVLRHVEAMAAVVQEFRRVHARCPRGVDELVGRSGIRRH